METQAYFSGIRGKIIEHLGAAKDTVLVAVAWLTDRECLMPWWHASGAE